MKLAVYMAEWYVKSMTDENVTTESSIRFDSIHFGQIMANIRFLAKMAVIFLYKWPQISIGRRFAILALKLLKFFLVGPEV